MKSYSRDLTVNKAMGEPQKPEAGNRHSRSALHKQEAFFSYCIKKTKSKESIERTGFVAERHMVNLKLRHIPGSAEQKGE